MTFQDPIVDRSQTDIDHRNHRAYLNITDWMRIYGNSRAAKELLEMLLSVSVAFDEVAEPTIATIPTPDDLNLILGNIERIRQASNLPPISGLDEVAHDWQPGVGAASPDYEDVNLWERVIQIVADTIAEVMNYQAYCGVGRVGQPRFWQNRFILFDGFTPDLATPERYPRAGVSVCSDDLTGQNMFRDYD